MRNGASLFRQCIAEMLGTAILVFIGLGAGNASVLAGGQINLWQVAMVWGVAVALAIYATGAISGAHINPALTLALAVFGGFPGRKIVPYIAAQLAGAVLASLALTVLFSGTIKRFEAANGLVRGESGSELSAMVYGEYFPNPAVARQLKWDGQTIGIWQAMAAEAFGAAVIALTVFGLNNRTNTAAPASGFHPILIGLTVSVCICVLSPLSQAGFNPARDFGPRLVAYFAGWGSVAIPGPRGGFFTVYILSPIIGALAGAATWRWAIHPSLVQAATPAPEAAFAQAEQSI